MERRVLLALFLSFLVFYIYQALMPAPPVPEEGAQGTEVAGPAAPGPPQAAAPAPAEPTAAPPVAPAPQGTTVVGDTEEQEISVETSRVIAVFTNRGGRLRSWRLKNYRNQETGEPLELVVNELQDTHPLPFSLRVTDEGTTNTLNNAFYAVTRSEQGGSTTVAFAYSNSEGLHAEKTFRIEPDSYLLSFSASVQQAGHALEPSIQWGPGLADAGAETSRFHLKPEGLVFVGDDVDRYTASAIAKQSTYEGTYRLAGVEDHYFMATAIDPGPSTIAFQPVSVPAPPGTDAAEKNFVSYTLTPEQMASPITFFIGPKDFDTLAAIDPAFTRAVNFGIFTVIVVPLLRSLTWLNGYVGNYGWSIVLLTVLINALLFPLNHKSVVSMRKMQEIQPEVKAIQERYSKLKSSDPAKQKMNQEMMDLYRQRGVNPASGCLPMLLTIPVLYAFYSLLSTAIQLRGAPFVFWIHDLSLPDPYYVAPVLMGASQLWQQKMSPATGVDPAQQKMMMLMPVMFTVLFLWAPSGVAVYWLVSNVWRIGQQALTNYLIGPPKVHNVRPAAERRVKRAGSGKSEAAARES